MKIHKLLDWYKCSTQCGRYRWQVGASHEWPKVTCKLCLRAKPKKRKRKRK